MFGAINLCGRREKPLKTVVLILSIALVALGAPAAFSQEGSRNPGRAMIPARYPDIGKVLDLSPEEVHRLFDLRARQETDGVREVSAQVNGGEAGVQALGRRMQADEAELASMLGGKYPQWQEYRSELPSRQDVRDLGVALDADGMPLDDAQAVPLTAALVAAQRRIDQETDGFQDFSARYVPENNRKLVEAASPYLSPQQLEVYQQLLERKGSMARALMPPGLIESLRRTESGTP